MLPSQVTSWKPRSYQKDGVKLMIQQACAGLLYKPGRGKTSVVYMATRILQDKQFVQRVLVICPLRPAYVVWPEQKDKYAEFAHLRVGLLHGPDKEAVLASDDYDMYVINPEGLVWLTNATTRKDKKGKPQVTLDPIRMKWLRERFQMLVVDESTKFKNSQTQRFKLLRPFIPFFKRRYILTGTPTPRSLQDLFGQIYILDEGAALGRYVTHYRTNYFYPDGYGGYDWQPQPDAMDRVSRRISPLVQVVNEKAGLGIPELTFNDIWIDLPPKVRTLYDRMEDDLIALMKTGTVVAANAAVASSKCRQIANGCIFDSETKGVYHEVHDEKLNALEDLLDQLQGAPALITYEFQFDAVRIHKRCEVPSISTGSAKQDAERIRKFGAGLLPAVMGQTTSISLGIDGLQENCCDIIMFGIGWDLLHYEQVINRVQRSGSKSKFVTIHRIMARDTVDEKALRVLDDRDRKQQDFLAMLKRMR